MTTATRSRKGVIALALIVILSFGMVLSAGALDSGAYTPSLSINNPYAPTHEFDFFANVYDVYSDTPVADVSIDEEDQTVITLKLKDPVGIKVYSGETVYFDGEGIVEDVAATDAGYYVESYDPATGIVIIIITNNNINLETTGIRLTFGVEIINPYPDHGSYTATLKLSPIED
jgi:hypothetical protein